MQLAKVYIIIIIKIFFSYTFAESFISSHSRSVAAAANMCQSVNIISFYDDETEQNRKEENKNRKNINIKRERERERRKKENEGGIAAALSILLSIGTSYGATGCCCCNFLPMMMMMMMIWQFKFLQNSLSISFLC
jgi:hypothetical protein